MVVLLVVVVFFPFGRYDKKKGQAVALVLSLFVGCVLFYPIALGITKLLQAVSILRELPTIHAAVNWSLLWPIIFHPYPFSFSIIIVHS